MRKIILLATFVVFAFANEVGFIKESVGDVKVKRSDDYVAMKAKDRLQVGDVLITGKSSHVGVIFDDGSTISLDEGSYLLIDDFVFKPIEEIYKFNLQLDKGSALFESGKIGKISPESFEFKIPEGVIGVRGTKFLVKVK